jgi:selenide, water dikinase
MPWPISSPMKTSSNSPLVKHLVLIGGGHSHLAVLKHLGMNPVPGLAVTLISRDINTPYSGCLPGFISGSYRLDEIHIDLRPLAQFAGARIIQHTIEHIDLESKLISCGGRPDIEFDVLSLNIGSKPDAIKIPGASEYAIGVKPIDTFLQRWQLLFAEAVARIGDQSSEYDLLIVGGGPASVELAFAAQYRIHQELGIKLYQPSPLNIKIISADSGLLSLHNAKVSRFALQELEKRGIEVLLEQRVSEFQAGKLRCEDGRSFSADAMVYATGASIPQWPAASGLAISEDGFIEVNHFLQSTSHEFVFAAGDAASILGEPRPKSGVYAVRQGLPLAENLIRYATARKLKPHVPQKHALALISMANKTAIASRNNLFFKGRSVWSLKHSIDTAFIKKYSQLPEMSTSLEIAEGLVDADTERQLKKHAMRCAGCGAKVAGHILQEVLQQLPPSNKADVLTTGAKIEDASLIRIDDDRVLVQSIDQLRAFINDPWLFAKIATNHCLSDIYAMGCFPHSALAVVSLPMASTKLTRNLLQEVMLGCSEALQENDCSLIGGHSAESAELQFGLCVNGFADKKTLLSKGGMQAGDIIILSKPLGSGTLLAADMRYKAKHDWINNALQQMLISNKQAAECFVQNKASACTDITGFGLAGHLLEMLAPNNVEMELNLADVPALDGALETLQQGIFSSLHQDNSLVSRDIFNSEAYLNNARFELLFDPQTAGGLLASVAESAAENCIRQLRENGFEHACAIGRVTKVAANSPAIVLK